MAATPLPHTAPAENRSPAAPETSVAGHRRIGWGRSGLRSVRAQLLAPIIVATAGLAVLGTLQTTAAATEAADAIRAQVLAVTATETVRLVHEVDREMAETAAQRLRNGKTGEQLVTAQRRRTDAAAARYRKASQSAVGRTPQLAETLHAANVALDALGAARATALTSNVASASSEKVYLNLSTALITVADALPARIVDVDLANQSRAVAAIAAVEHLDSVQRDLVRTILSRGSLLAGEATNLATLVGQRTQRLSEFNRVADADSVKVFNSMIQGADVEGSVRIRSIVLDGSVTAEGARLDADTWYTLQSGTIRRVYMVGLSLTEKLDAQARGVSAKAKRSAWTVAVGTAGLAILALTTAILLAIRTSRRLRQLRVAALAVARRELPEAIAAVAVGDVPVVHDGQESASAITKAIASTNDEIGQVADAFGSVHRTALRLAGQQAEMHIDVSRMVEILARRIRTLITRQLRLLDDFEREETDPDALSRLFALDHLAARLRRNGENLLVLSGHEPGRQFSQAFPLSGVVTAAASEIEDFTRVEASVGDIDISGGVVGDLVHLLAELLENATTFSPPDTSVRVDARRTIDGAVVRVHDSGIGITGGRLEEINARLLEPVKLTSAAAGTMGLHVVAHLASRHNITVQLHPTGTGTVAYVALPTTALAAQASLSSGPRTLPVERSAVPAIPGRSHVAGRPVVPAVEARRIPHVEDTAWFRPLPDGGDVEFSTAHAVGEVEYVHSGHDGSATAAGAPARIPAQRTPGYWNESGSATGAQPEIMIQRPVPVRRPTVRSVDEDPGASAGEQRSAEAGRAVPMPVAGHHPATWSQSTAAWPTKSPAQTTPATSGEYPMRSKPPVWPPAPTAATADGDATPASSGSTGPATDPVQASGAETAAAGSAAPGDSAGATDWTENTGNLPRRRPGALLAPETAVVATPVKSVDPELVRTRLSAFAEGVSAAGRSRTIPSTATKER